VAALSGYAFLYVPLVIVVVYSFNDSRLNAEWVGFTLDWYRKLFADDEMLTAAANSLAIGVSASLASTVLGTMAGVAMHRYRLRVLPVLVLAPIAIPEILMGVSLLIFSCWSISRSVSCRWRSRTSLFASASSPSSCARASPAWTRA